MGQEDNPPAGLGRVGHLDQWGKGQKVGLVEGHHRQGSHTQEVVGNSHPEVHTLGLLSGHTLEGSLTWTFHLRGGEVQKRQFSCIQRR